MSEADRKGQPAQQGQDGDSGREHGAPELPEEAKPARHQQDTQPVTEDVTDLPPEMVDTQRPNVQG